MQRDGPLERLEGSPNAIVECAGSSKYPNYIREWGVLEHADSTAILYC